MRPLDWRALGLEYLDGAKRYRMTDKPIFTDKRPDNFPFVGLLHLILPNAKIINARRHPLDTCLGNYKQLFGRGLNFTYDIFELADYYKEYCLTMDHWNEVLPGKVLDVHYEETVTDLEGQVARILEHCGLPFEEKCVRFHETERAIKTASSEQVRQRSTGAAWANGANTKATLAIGWKSSAGLSMTCPTWSKTRGSDYRRVLEGPNLKAMDRIADIHG